LGELPSLLATDRGEWGGGGEQMEGKGEKKNRKSLWGRGGEGAGTTRNWQKRKTKKKEGSCKEKRGVTVGKFTGRFLWTGGGKTKKSTDEAPQIGTNKRSRGEFVQKAPKNKLW